MRTVSKRLIDHFGRKLRCLPEAAKRQGILASPHVDDERPISRAGWSTELGSYGHDADTSPRKSVGGANAHGATGTHARMLDVQVDAAEVQALARVGVVAPFEGGSWL